MHRVSREIGVNVNVDETVGVFLCRACGLEMSIKSFTKQNFKQHFSSPRCRVKSTICNWCVHTYLLVVVQKS